MCGEKIRAVSATTASVGSPPRVRGKAVDVDILAGRRGITPACAGKSGSSRHCEMSQKGSPPRVRGKGPENVPVRVSGRITPACAGKSTASSPSVCHLRDHPRVCGEKSLTLEGGFSLIGSPPRVRGKALAVLTVMVVLGITPACAGKRLLVHGRACRPWDHPRVCGEKRFAEMTYRFHAGSPPRVRGKGGGSGGGASIVGITPACAGKSFWATNLTR